MVCGVHEELLCPGEGLLHFLVADRLACVELLLEPQVDGVHAGNGELQAIGIPRHKFVEQGYGVVGDAGDRDALHERAFLDEHARVLEACLLVRRIPGEDPLQDVKRQLVVGGGHVVGDVD